MFRSTRVVAAAAVLFALIAVACGSTSEPVAGPVQTVAPTTLMSEATASSGNEPTSTTAPGNAASEATEVPTETEPNLAFADQKRIDLRDPDAMRLGFASGSIDTTSGSAIIEEAEWLLGAAPTSFMEVADGSSAQLVALDRSGDVVQNAPFVVSQVSGDVVESFNWSPDLPPGRYRFNANMLMSVEVAALVVEVDGIELHRWERSPTAPRLVLNREGTIVTWETADDDDDPVDVVAIFDGGNDTDLVPIGGSGRGLYWSSPVEGAEPIEQGVDVSLAGVEASSDGRVVVVANDGFNVTVAEVADLAVASLPPEVFVNSPSEGGEYWSGTWMLLEASVLIAEDGGYSNHSERLDDHEVLWSSNLDGEIGRGPTVEIGLEEALPLRVGVHEITVTVTAPDGQTASDTVQITVTE